MGHTKSHAVWPESAARTYPPQVGKPGYDEFTRPFTLYPLDLTYANDSVSAVLDINLFRYSLQSSSGEVNELLDGGALYPRYGLTSPCGFCDPDGASRGYEESEPHMTPNVEPKRATR